MRGPIIAASAVAAVALTLAPAASAAPRQTRLVDDAPSSQCRNAQYSTIQAAVDAAQPGELIQLCGGTYREDVSVPASKGRLTFRPQSQDPVVLEGDFETRAPLHELRELTVHGSVRVVDTRIRAMYRMTIEGGGLIGTRGAVRYLTRNRISAPSGSPAISMTTDGSFGRGGLSLMEQNVVTGGSIGIELRQADCTNDDKVGVDVTRNRVTGAGVGLAVECIRTIARRNGFLDGGTGIRVGAGTGTWLYDNVVRGNSGDGIVLDGQSDARLGRNRAAGNDGTDCVDTSTGDRTLATANRWVVNFGDDASPAGLCLPATP